MIATSGEPKQYPSPNIILGTGLVSNTEYNVSVMTTVTIRNDGKTVNSDYSELHQGLTG